MLNKHRFLFEELVKRDFDRKYKGSFFGAAFLVCTAYIPALLNPDPVSSHPVLYSPNNASDPPAGSNLLTTATTFLRQTH